MTIESLKFLESSFTGQTVSELPNIPSEGGFNGAAVKARMDNIGKVLIALGSFNDLIDALLATTTGDSGAANIGSEAISGVTGATIRAQLINLKAQLDAVVLGEIPDASLTNAKLATDVKVGSLAALTTTEKTSVTGAINELDSSKENKELEILTVTESKTLAATDLNVLQNCTHASDAIVATVPTGLWEYGIPIPFKRGGAADASVVAGDGVTINQTKLKIANQGDYAVLIPTETSETYDFIGKTKV